MNIYILFALCFLPVIALFAIFSIVTKDHPVFRYAISCAFGIATVAPASFIQFLTLKIPTFSSPSFFSILITAILFNGFIEESFNTFSCSVGKCTDCRCRVVAAELRECRSADNEQVIDIPHLHVVVDC